MSSVSYNDSIDLYKDYTYIMYILCDKTASFYSKIKNIINIPIIICSTGLSILNTNNFDKNIFIISITRNIGIGFNLLIAISIAILNYYKITEKEYAFKTSAKSFLELHDKINFELTKSKTINSSVDILKILDEYNLYCEQIAFHIPSRIRRSIIKEYKSYNLPLLLLNNKKHRKILKTSYFDMYKSKMKTYSSNNSTHMSKVSISDVNNKGMYGLNRTFGTYDDINSLGKTNRILGNIKNYNKSVSIDLSDDSNDSSLSSINIMKDENNKHNKNLLTPIESVDSGILVFNNDKKLPIKQVNIIHNLRPFIKNSSNLPANFKRSISH